MMAARSRSSAARRWCSGRNPDKRCADRPADRSSGADLPRRRGDDPFLYRSARHEARDFRQRAQGAFVRSPEDQSASERSGSQSGRGKRCSDRGASYRGLRGSLPHRRRKRSRRRCSPRGLRDSDRRRSCSAHGAHWGRSNPSTCATPTAISSSSHATSTKPGPELCIPRRRELVAPRPNGSASRGLSCWRLVRTTDVVWPGAALESAWLASSKSRRRGRRPHARPAVCARRVRCWHRVAAVAAVAAGGAGVDGARRRHSGSARFGSAIASDLRLSPRTSCPFSPLQQRVRWDSGTQPGAPKFALPKRCRRNGKVLISR